MSNCNKPKKNSGRSGFSLIEIIIAFSILSVAYIGMMRSFPLALSINKSSELGTVSAYLAQSKIEEVSSLAYENIATGTIEALHRLSATTTDYLYQFERETLCTNVDGNLAASSTDSGIKKISSTVYFHDPSTRARKSLNITILNTKR